MFLLQVLKFYNVWPDKLALMEWPNSCELHISTLTRGQVSTFDFRTYMARLVRACHTAHPVVRRDGGIH
jgi:hypothetical protein